MKTCKTNWLPAVFLLAALLTGCTNPPTQPTAYVDWPADIPPLPTNSPAPAPKLGMATSRAAVGVSPVPQTLEQFASRMGGSCLGLFEPAGDGTNYVIGNQCLTDYGVCCILSYNTEPTKVDTGTTNSRTWEHVYLISNAEAARYMTIRTSLPQNIFATLP